MPNEDEQITPFVKSLCDSNHFYQRIFFDVHNFTYVYVYAFLHAFFTINKNVIEGDCMIVLM